MAAAFVNQLAGEKVRVSSAGTSPAETVHPAVVEAMAEVGVDLSGSIPSLLEDDSVRAADVVVTMGCGDACPVYRGKRYEDWEVGDPAGRPLSEVRAIRDDIRNRVERLLSSLVPENVS